MEFLAPIFKCQRWQICDSKQQYIKKNTYTIQLENDMHDFTYEVFNMQQHPQNQLDMLQVNIDSKPRGLCTPSSTHCYVLMIVQ